MSHSALIFFLVLLCVSLLPAVTWGDAPMPVTLTQTADTYTLANGLVTAVIDKASGGLLSLRYAGTETLDAGPHAAGYWSHEPRRGPGLTDTVTIDPSTNNGERAEIAIKGIANGEPQGAGPGGGVIADIAIRWTLQRGMAGIYTYTIFTHPPQYPATSVGEARFAVKLNESVFDWLTVDANRNHEMITAYDWDHGTRLNMKEARRMTTGNFIGQVEHKYDYSADQFDTPAYGWSSTAQHIGFWMINPSSEYLSGGPTKVELTTHRDATFTDSLTAPAPPVVLNYWRGSHYGGSVLDVNAGENWSKVVGPFLLYCNTGATHDVLWQDALRQAGVEAHQWPYGWVSGVDYPHENQRATVTGSLVVHDPLAPAAAQVTDLLVGLTAPDYTEHGHTVDWQHDAKFYQFWTHADTQGNFVIPHVRPGTYTLHAIATGVLGEYIQTNVTVTTGGRLDLGKLTWTPVRYGRQLWDIGIPNRSASEFLHGNDYWHWGLYLLYPRDFPSDVNYIIGKSNYHSDWNYAQVPRAPAGDTDAHQPGAPTTWTVHFALPQAPATGWAVLRLAICGAAGIPLTVTVNNHAAATVHLTYNATINRDGIQGDWVERDVVFPASFFQDGNNALQLAIPGGNVMSGVEYDYLRLELSPSARPPTLPASVTSGVDSASSP
jgi:rhamnogalacturonan endolyase